MKLKIALLTMLFCALLFPKAEEIYDLLDVIKLGNPITYKNLRIFPINLTKTLDHTQYVTLDEGVKRGYLKIKEVGSGEVNEVYVKNTSIYKIFIMTGEVILGAKQDRMLKEDVLVPSRSDWISLPVYCTEHGRWTEVSKEFKSSGNVMAPGALRQRAKASESQSEVWDEIAGTQSRLKVPAPTQALRDVFENKDVQEQSKPYFRHFENLPGLAAATIGVVVTVGDNIVCVDLFANHGLLNKMWAKLLKSYVLDAIQGEEGALTRDDVEDFLAELEDAGFDHRETPGLGSLLKIDIYGGVGSALIYKSSVIHLDLFPTSDSHRSGSRMNLDFRREERTE